MVVYCLEKARITQFIRIRKIKNKQQLVDIASSQIVMQNLQATRNRRNLD